MEEWQKQHISENLPKLIPLTKCTVLLKARLRSKDIGLTEEDWEKLECIRSNQGMINETHHLYTILQAKSNSYGVLVDALHEERYTEAWKILTKDLEKYFLETRIILFQKEVKLQDLIPSFSIDNAKKILEAEGCKQEFITLRGAIQLTPNLPQKRFLYLPRKLSNRLVLDPSIFTKDAKDVFVFNANDMSRMELQELVKTYPTISSSNFQPGLPYRHIHLTKLEDWDDLVESIQAPLHLVCKEEKMFVLQRTTQVTDIILRHGTHERNTDAYISEESFVDEICSNTTSRTFCICDLPGMGKTWFLQHITREIQTIYQESHLVLFVALSEFTKKVSYDTTTAETSLKTLLDYVYDKRLPALITLQWTKCDNHKIAVFWDGFDEIGPARLKTTMNFIQHLNANWKNVKSCISARPNMRKLLEEKFGAVSYDILPFSRNDQVKALTDNWETKFTKSGQLYDINLLHEFAGESIKQTSKLNISEKYDILGVPLKCFLLAGINEKLAAKFANPNRSYQVSDTIHPLSLCDMFDKYVEYTMNTSGQNMIGAETSHVTDQSVLELHTFKAMQLLFPEAAERFPKISHLTYESTKLKVQNMGILIDVGDSSVFIHRSFAEYFVGKYFANQWNSSGRIPKTELDKCVAKYFFEKILQVAESQELTFHDNHSEYEITISPTTFIHGTVLWFVNSLLKPSFARDDNARPEVICLLKTQVYKIVMACIRGGLTSILRFVIETLKATLKPNEITELCTPQNFVYVVRHLHESDCNAYYRSRFKDESDIVESDGDTEQEIGAETTEDVFSGMKSGHSEVCFMGGHCACPSTQELEEHQKAAMPLALIYLLASQGNLAQSHDILSLPPFATKGYVYTTFKDNKKLPSVWKILIGRHNVDLALCYIKLIPISCQYSLQDCIVTSASVSKDEVKSRCDIFDALVNQEPRVLQEYMLDKQEDSRFGYNSEIMLYISSTHKFNWNNTSAAFKDTFLIHTLKWGNDQKFVDVLLLFFPQQPETCNQFCLSNQEAILNEGSQWTSSLEVCLSRFMDLIDVTKVRNFYAAKNLVQENPYICWRLTKLFTLELLRRIFGDMSEMTSNKCNLLHIAVSHGKTQWVEYLLRNGFDVNIHDSNKRTPLLHMSCTTDCRDIMKLLIDNGADVYAVDINGNNVAHRMVIDGFCDYELHPNCKSWISFMFDKGFYKIWLTPNKDMETPLNLIEIKYGVTNETRLFILDSFMRLT